MNDRTQLLRFASLGGLAIALLALLLLTAGRTSTAQETDAAATARSYLSRNATALGLTANLHDLRPEVVRQGLTGKHVRFQQTIGGVPVFGAYISVSLPEGAPAFASSRYASGLQVAPAKVNLLPSDAATAAVAAAGVTGTASATPGGFAYYVRSKEDVRLAWQVIASTRSPDGEWLTLVDAETGEVLYRTNLLAYDEGRVFDPNPGATNNGVPAAPDCDTPVNETKLAPEYQTVTLQGIDPGQGKLKGAYVDLTAPGIEPSGYKNPGLADSPDHKYDYRCNDDRFEEVMAYYHLDATQRKLQALGFSGQSALIDRPIPVHAHYMKDCNAYYNPLNGGLHFGDSNDPVFCGTLKMDLAEDGDVVVHEYGHALQHELVPGWAFGPYPEAEEARSMGEGWGDFLAAVMSGDPCTGEYASFGLTECGGKPGLRWLDIDMVYPQDFEACMDVDMNGDGVPESEEEHCGGQVWGAALWDLAEQIGGGTATQEARDTALRLVVEAHFYLDPASTFNEAAAAICMVDGLLYGGAHSSAIGDAFGGRGMSSGSCLSDDFEYFYYQVRHTFSGDLDVNVLVGQDPGAPVCEINLGDPLPLLFFSDWYTGYVVTDFFACGDYMPPSASLPWRLEVRDTKAGNTGTIVAFNVMLRGGSRCTPPETPIDVPDNGGPVYAFVDCSTVKQPTGPTPLLPTPTPAPPAAGDIDCDGRVNSVDSLMILRYVSGMPVNQHDPCPAVGGGSIVSDIFGDVDCDQDVDSVDSLQVLRFIAGLPVEAPDGCPPVGRATPTPRPTPPPPPTPTPGAGSITVRNGEWHIDPAGYLVAAGEVVNGSGKPVGLVRVEVNLFNASGELLKKGVGYSCLATVPAGGDSPFEVLVFAPGAVDHVTAGVTQFVDPPFLPAPEGLQGQITEVYTDQIGYLHAKGNVTNNSGKGYKLVKACLAFYDPQGLVYRSKFSFTSPNLLGPGGSGTFDASIKTDGVPITNQRVWADAMPQ